MTATLTTLPAPQDLPHEAAALLPRLASHDEAVRRIALLDLADLEEPDTVPLIIAALRDDPAEAVRAEAARRLAAWPQEDVIETLCQALLDQDDEVRHAAAQSLSELNHPASGPTLAVWAAHATPFVRQSTLRGLRELRHPAAFEPARQALGDAHAEVRFEAVSVLGWLKDERALVALASLASTDPAPDVRRAAVGALGFAATVIEPAVVAALLGALHDTVWQVREEAAGTLGKLRADAGEPLIEALDDPYWQVRLRAARALGQLRDARAVSPVAGLLTHTISNLRKEAALTLGELRDPASLPALTRALEDPDPEVRKAVRIAVQQIGDTQ